MIQLGAREKLAPAVLCFRTEVVALLGSILDFGLCPLPEYRECLRENQELGL